MPYPAQSQCEAGKRRQQPTSQHCCACPSTFTPPVHATQCRKDVIAVNARFAGDIEFVGKDIQHQLTVAICIDVSMCLLIEEVFQLEGIDEVAVVRETYAIGTVDEERLRLSVCACARGGISKVSKSY